MIFIQQILPILLLVYIFITETFSIDYVHSPLEELAYYEQFSHLPILHIYHNSHFSKSPQFKDFMETISVVEDRVSNYARILITDCDLQKQKQQSSSCKQIKRRNENRFIVGFAPSSSMTTFGSKLVQSPPANRLYDRHSDRYDQDELVNFINQLTPQFYKHLHNIPEYQRFLDPKYVPKIIFICGEDDPDHLPLVMKQISIEYYLRFDFGFVEDITDDIVDELKISSFPALLLVKYDFQTNTRSYSKYQGKSFLESNYPQIKDFLSPHALTHPRNDILYHKIKKQNQSEILTVYTEGQLKQALERANGWVIIQKSPSLPNKLIELKEKYNKYYDYIHFVQQNEPILSFYSPNLKQAYKIGSDVKFNALSKENFLQNVSLWLDRDYTLLAVRQQFAHLCALAEKSFFRGIVYCLIAQEDQYEQISNSFGVRFDIGLVWGKKLLSNGSKMATGVQITSSEFDIAYDTLEYRTKLRVKDLLDKFLTDPIDQILISMPISQICFFDNKKCAFFLTTSSSKKDSTKKDYVQQIAIFLAEQYRFFKVNAECNQQFVEELKLINSKLNYTQDRLIVYHPKLHALTLMETKMTKLAIEQFLRQNQGPMATKISNIKNQKLNLFNCQEIADFAQKNKDSSISDPFKDEQL